MGDTPRRFIEEDDGQDLIEYALLAALISVAIAAAVTSLKGNLGTVLNNVATALGSAGS